MKRFIALLIVVSSLLVAFSSPALAWCCQARNPTGSLGWAMSDSPGRAQHNAPSQCIIHTPSLYICVVTFCR